MTRLRVSSDVFLFIILVQVLQRVSEALVVPGPGRAFALAQDSDDDRSAKNLNWDLYIKAMTFGQSLQEREKVEDILQKLNQLTAARLPHVPAPASRQGPEAVTTPAGGPSTRVPSSESADAAADTAHADRPAQTGSAESAEEAEPLDYAHVANGTAASSDEAASWSLRQNDVVSARPRKIAKIQPGRFTEDAKPGEAPEEKGRHFEGDIVLSADQAEAMYDALLHQKDARRKRKFIASPSRRWNPNAPIDYGFDGSHSKNEQKIIELALQHWQNITCLTFRRKDDEPRGNRLVFTDVDGCASNVGRHPLGEPQFVSIAPECLRLGVIAHEVAHALGFWHEQSRPDRDRYVDVLWKNIEDGSMGQFLKEQPEDVNYEGMPYDYGSIMHYRSKAFAKLDSLYTIETNVKDYQRTIGQRDQLSFNDIKLMNYVYCRSKCLNTLPCRRGGYTDPKDCSKCRCPDGFTGNYCEEVMPGYGSECGGQIPLTSDYYYITSPDHPRPFKAGQECSWMFKAPPGQFVELEFVYPFDLYCKLEHSLCMDYVEVRNSSDFSNTGMRYCCYTPPPNLIYSSTDEMLVLFRSFYKSGKGFKARARARASI